MGMITFLRKTNSSTTISRKRPATIKNPAAGLSNAVPIHQARPKNKKDKKNILKNVAAIITAAEAAALEAPCVVFALISSAYVFAYSLTCSFKFRALVFSSSMILHFQTRKQASRACFL